MSGILTPNTEYLEYCPICRCLAVMSLHTIDMCKHLANVRCSLFEENQGTSDLTLERISRILDHLKNTMQEHEKTCGMCSFWVREDSRKRCTEYQHMQEIKFKWAKRHDDAH